jgi:hypothetical protein
MEQLKIVLGWVLRIIPPLMLLPLALIPVDIFTILLWAIGWLCLFVSVYSLVSKFIKKKNSIKNLVRPILTVCVFALAYISLQTSFEIAKSESLTKANEILSICNKGKCPQTIEGWKPTEHVIGKFYISVGGLTKYPLFYKPSERLDSFKLTLRVNFEEEYTYVPRKGGIFVDHRVW